MKQYKPHSHFFTDLSSLAAANGNDGFGPVAGSLTTKYRVTSKVKAINASPAKLYAICDGRMLIQPSTDNNKINIIIKPSTNNYSPLKIKYFIYRGINKADYFTNNVLNQPDVNKPITVTKLWTTLLALNGLTSPSGNIFPLEYIYDFAAPGTKLIDEAFQKSLVSCIEGDYIGNFNDEVGLDIVLDDGEYIFENQEILFSYNLDFARAQEFIFDIGSLSDTKKKRLKENIHQFLDAAAFWGSHINCGIIKYKDGIKVSNISSISEILKKYQTGNKLYIYIQGENNRSFNYYDSTRKVYGFSGTSPEPDNTNGWPILIKQLLNNSPQNINFQCDYTIESTTLERNSERNISVNVIAPNVDLLAYPSTERPQISGEQFGSPAANISGKSASISITFEKESSFGFCASFVFLNYRMFQKFPVDKYYNDLWAVNVKNSFSVDTTTHKLHYITYDKSRNINLDDVIGESAIIKNRIIFDEGKNGTLKKRRRLFIAEIKHNSGTNVDYEELNIDVPNSGFLKKDFNTNDYFSSAFNDIYFSIYKGSFNDSQTIHSLSLFHEKFPFKKKAFMSLGITEEEYGRFVIPPDADNVFFNLKEISFSNENVKKFKLGLRYEDASGQINTNIYYPTGNDILIYSVDDLFFFSAEYSKYQHYYKELAPLKVEFKTIPRNPVPFLPVSKAYDGEFGFDWLRDGDNPFKEFDPPNALVPGIKIYDGLINGYNKYSSVTSNMTFINKDDAFKSLKREYYSLPINSGLYNIPFLTLFSKDYRDKNVPKIDSSGFTPPEPTYKATLRLIIKNPLIKKGTLKFEFSETGAFTVIPATITNLQSNDNLPMNLSVEITCLKDIAKQQLVKVMFYPNGSKEALLAGCIVVNRNDSLARKDLNVVLVSCNTDVDIDGILEFGAFGNSEKESLYKGLHQSLIVPNVIYHNNLPLQTEPKYQKGGWFVFTDSITGIDYISTIEGIHGDLQSRIPPAYNNKKWLKIYAFDVPGKALGSTGAGGITEHVGVRSVVLYQGRDNKSIVHEAYHALGLYHTHDDNEPIKETDKKYTFLHAKDPSNASHQFKSTDNYMSYSIITNNIWNWQKEIVNRILDND